MSIPSAQTGRLVAPDLARGFTLLGIAIANATTAWLLPKATLPAREVGGIVDDSLGDKIAIVAGDMFVHVRGLPMFATLLGYGVGMIAMSLYRRKYPLAQARAVLLRRYGFLALFGALHMVFLFFGDIMFAYGCIGMFLACLISVSDKILLRIAAGLAVFFSVVAILFAVAVSVFAPNGMPNSFSGNQTGGFLSGGIAETYPRVLGDGLLTLFANAIMLFTFDLAILPVMLLGFVAARHNAFARIDEFKKYFLLAVAISVVIILGVGLPLGLAHIGVFPARISSALSLMNQMVGFYSGPGIAALIALAAQPFQRRAAAAAQQGRDYSLPWFLAPVAALGKRSMTGYLLQSIIFFILTAPFLIGISRDRGALHATGVAIAVWCATLVLTYGMELLGLPGPFEKLHRHLSYGRRGLYKEYPQQLAEPAYPQLPSVDPKPAQPGENNNPLGG